MSEHSPLPWESRKRGYVVAPDDAYVIAECDNDADAAFIVQCVNEHTALQAERDELRAYVEACEKGPMAWDKFALNAWIDDVRTKARALLARKDTA